MSDQRHNIQRARAIRLEMHRTDERLLDLLDLDPDRTEGRDALRRRLRRLRKLRNRIVEIIREHEAEVA